jgi:hypothetical protein
MMKKFIQSFILFAPLPCSLPGTLAPCRTAAHCGKNERKGYFVEPPPHGGKFLAKIYFVIVTQSIKA